MTRFGPTSRRRSARALTAACAVAAVMGSAHVVLWAHENFSLITRFAEHWSADNGSCTGGAGICNDNVQAYTDLSEGVESWSNAYGNIQILTTASSSTRRICFSFPESPTLVHDAAMFARFVPEGGLSGCYPAAFNTLANSEYGATDVGHDTPSPQPISGWTYFFVGGLQYELHWKRQGVGGLASSGPPMKVQSLDAPTWFLNAYEASDATLQVTADCPNCRYVEPGCPESCATLAVFSNNKPRGRVFLANYVMPFALTADTDPTNRRRKGKM